ncbi:MAG: SusC/RagA family TonB-linked outer membrane protein, partial [Gemmatimonadota bacterium]
VYFLRNVPAGVITVRVVRLGYNQSSASVTVVAGQTVTLDFTLTAAPFTLDEIVTTATGQQRKAELGNVVNLLQVAELIKEAPVKSMADLLQGRAPGVSINQSSGGTGAGARIRIRGSNSVSLSNEPIFIVDGVRIESAPSSTTIGVGGQSPSRINDINPEDIESIEVVKGPSAAALYGTRAANGVVLIKTKRGTAGRARWNAWAEQGRLTDETDYPDNYRGGSDAAANTRCRLHEQAAGTCTIATIKQFNPTRDSREAPLVTGNRQQYGLSVSGGSEAAQYYLSAEQEWERGVYGLSTFEADRLREKTGRQVLRDDEVTPNWLRKTNVRANLTAQLTPKASVALSTGFVDSKLRRPQNDNNILGILSSSLNGDGRGVDNPDFGWGFFQPGDTYQLGTEQGIQRLTTSALTTYTPTSWLSLRSLLGLDLTSRIDNQLNRLGEGPAFATFQRGLAREDRRTIQQYTVNFGGTANFQLTDAISSKTTVGVQWGKDSFKGTNAFGQFLPPGSVTIGSGSTQFAGEVTIESIVFGSYVEQVFGYKDRLFFTGAVRADRNSAVGQNFGTKVYPKAGLSYLISDESFFPTGSFLSSFRLRGAWGESGLQPGTTDPIAFFSPVTVAAVSGSDEAGVLLGGFGNDELRPETSRETELGFDATFFNSRIALEATYYDKKSRDALVQVTTPPSAGFPTSRFENLGAVRNQGIEVTLNTQVFTTKNLAWDVTLTGSFIKNRLTDLGGQPPVNLNGSSQQARAPVLDVDGRPIKEYPLGGYWVKPMTWNDNGDGLVAQSEIVTGDTLEFLGASQPTREIGLNTSLSLLNNRVRVSAQFDYRGGNYLWNLNEEFRCRSSNNCIGLYDANAPEFERLRAAAITLSAATRSNAGYFEKADFVKLREVSVTFFAPASWNSWLGTDRMSLTVSGRNLAVWTDYTGLDPELNGQGNGNFAQREFLTQPPTRNISARLNLSF